MKIVRLLLYTVLIVLMTVSSAAAGSMYLDQHVWPISGTTLPDGPLSSAFGPRLMASEDFRYDFHRGIDLPADSGTDVHAAADGEVRLAGDYSFYSDTIVQIRHTKPDGGYYYTNYMHLSGVSVTEGQEVIMGDIIGRTGASESGFAHLHFEIRDEGIYQRNCINPFVILPYDDLSTPDVTIDTVDLSIPLEPIVTATVTLPREEWFDDLDFNRVQVSIYKKAGRKLQLLDQHEYNMTDWNFLFTLLQPDDPNINMDDPDFNGISVSPARFNASSQSYEIGFEFYDLAGDANPDKLIIKVLAEDVKGNSTTKQYKSGRKKKK